MDLKIRGVEGSPWDPQEFSSTQLQRDTLEQQRQRIREVIQHRKGFHSPTSMKPGRTGLLRKNKKLGRKPVQGSFKNNNFPPIPKGKNSAKSSDTDGKVEDNATRITDKKLDENQHSIKDVSHPRIRSRCLLPISEANVCDLNEINLKVCCRQRQPGRLLKHLVEGDKHACGNENPKQQQLSDVTKRVSESVSHYEEVKCQQKKNVKGTKVVRFAEGTNFGDERERNGSTQNIILPSLVHRTERLWLHRRQQCHHKHNLKQSDKCKSLK